MVIYSKTDTGHRVMKDRSVHLNPRQRSAFILVDGKRDDTQILAATGVTGVTRNDLDYLVEHQLIQDIAPERTAELQAAAIARAVAVEQHKTRTPQERYAEAYPIAVGLTGGLGLRGFRLNLAVEAATSYEALVALAPKIKDAVGPEKYAPLDDALNDR